MFKEKKTNKDIDLQTKIISKFFEVSINILILIFIYNSLIGYVGRFASELYLNNNIVLNEIILFTLVPSSILYITFLGVNYMYSSKFKFKLIDLLAINFLMLAGLNYIAYFFETKDYKAFVIIMIILLFHIIRKKVILNTTNKFISIILLILFLGSCIAFYKVTFYSVPVDKKAKIVHFILGESSGIFETVLEIDGEIIFKNDKDFYYKVRDKINQEIDVTVKENKFSNDKVVELK